MYDVQVLAYGNHTVGVVLGAEQGMRGIQAHVVAVELRLVFAAQDTVLPGVGEAEGELRYVGTACQVDGVVLGYGTFVVGLVNPVSFPSNRSSARFHPRRKGFRRWLRGALPATRVRLRRR